ncbi:MAG: hypothetical protein JWM53_1915 [bacterium]|jgi:hypothetical protein|nr:hypothetical protein [bacterium]
MGHPVKLSEALVLDARLASETSERSIASQIEFWARIGRAMEPMLRTDALIRLKQRGDVRSLSECIASVDTDAGRQRTAAYLATRPYPHFEPAADRPGYLIKTDEDGTRTVGRFVNRQFQPVSDK